MNKLLRALIVDDEELCRSDLADLIAEENDVKVVGHAANIKEAIGQIHHFVPDLVFLDLNLNGQHGYQILREIPAPPAVIAVTAFSNHAVEGFDLDIADYVLKPVEPCRLKKAIARARNQIFHRFLRKNPSLTLKVNNRITQLNLADIYEVKSNENYVEIHAINGTKLVRSTFTNFSQKLPPGFTLEIARGHLLARHQISGWEKDEKGYLKIFMKYGKEQIVSKRMQQSVLAYLAEFH